MNRLCLPSLLVAATLATVTLSGEPAKTKSQRNIADATTVQEARARARLLHESFHGVLQIMHRDFFDDESPRAIPSASVEDVFDELSKQYHVNMKWLNVETDMVNSDHEPSDEFEQAAAVQLKEGKPWYDAVQGERYRYAGPIRLASQCLKCHVKNRTNTRDRVAGLLISMPLNVKPSREGQPSRSGQLPTQKEQKPARAIAPHE